MLRNKDWDNTLDCLVCGVPQKHFGGRIGHLKLENIQSTTLHLKYLQIPITKLDISVNILGLNGCRI